MLIGHIDGKGSVYDDSGTPILRPGEQLLCRVDGDNIDVTEGSGIWNMKTLFPGTAERGNLFVTDRRLLFLRKPDPFLAAKNDATAVGMADAVTAAVRAKDLRKMRAWEFCEIDFAEVEGFSVKKRKVGVLFLTSASTATRKALLYRRHPDDVKFRVLKRALSERLPTAEPEDRGGSFLLGVRYRFVFRRGRKIDSGP